MTLSTKPIIVVDFDDTLCLHPPHDKSNIKLGLPNKPLISKLQSLHKIYDIHIYTARGHLSCDSRQQAEETYRPLIESWLYIFEVPYKLLSFNKPLATYYIDDKAVRPDELGRLI